MYTRIYNAECNDETDGKTNCVYNEHDDNTDNDDYRQNNGK